MHAAACVREPSTAVTDSARPLLLLAREHLARHDHAAAETLLREVLRQRDDEPEAHHLMGLVHHERDDLAAARLSFQRALALDPTRSESALHLAITCNELGFYSEARKVSDAMAKGEGHPRVPSYARAHLADMHAETARAYEQLSAFDEAATEYRRALSLCPEHADYRTRLGVALRAAGDLAGACTELEAASQRSPSHAPAHVALGLTYFRLGRRADAARAWRKALEVAPQHRAAEVYLRMLDENREHLPSMVPPEPRGVDDELGELEVQVLGDRDGAG